MSVIEAKCDEKVRKVLKLLEFKRNTDLYKAFYDDYCKNLHKRYYRKDFCNSKSRCQMLEFVIISDVIMTLGYDHWQSYLDYCLETSKNNVEKIKSMSLKDMDLINEFLDKRSEEFELYCSDLNKLSYPAKMVLYENTNIVAIEINDIPIHYISNEEWELIFDTPFMREKLLKLKQ